MSKRAGKGLVFISYAHADRARVKPLLDLLAAEFDVWWDRHIAGGDSWRRTLMDNIDKARCFVVLWTENSVTREFIWSEVERAQPRGTVVPVLLDKDADIPLGFTTMQHIDLTTWRGRRTRQIGDLIARIDALVSRAPRQWTGYSTLADNDWAVRRSMDATRELARLTKEVRTIGGILVSGNGPVDRLIDALNEVNGTFEAVSDAIAAFLAPLAKRGRIKADDYLDMERGSLLKLINAKRGHCTQIVELYDSVGGLRDWLAENLEPKKPGKPGKPKRAGKAAKTKKLEEIDEVFAVLGQADGDLFQNLTDIGNVLTEEAGEVANFLLAGQQKLARERLLDARKKLLPLERSIRKASTDLLAGAGKLGYVPGAGQ